MMQETEGRGRIDWPEEVINQAYEVWAYLCGQQAKAARDRLQQEFGHDVPYRTFADWVHRYGWKARAHEDIARIAPDIQRATISELIMGGLEGARLLRRAVQPDVYLMDDDGNVRQDEHGRPLRMIKPDKNEVTAALGLLDRAGFSPLGRTPERTIDRPSSLPASTALASLSIDAVLQLQSELVDRLMVEKERTQANTR